MIDLLKYSKRTAVLLSAFMLFTFTACSDEKLDADRDYFGLGGNSEEETSLDEWLYEKYTKPYNIQVKYKWDPNELTTSAQLVPAFEWMVQPTMKLINDVWFEPYLQAAGVSFLMEMTPKWIYLVGSPQFNQDGSSVLGQAEGAMKITLYDVNSYNPKDEVWLKELLHTIEHEFAHILHQTEDYSSEFRNICAGSYTSTGWQNYGETTALLEGFYSNYAMSEADEDFVETISLLMVYGMEWRQERIDFLEYYATLPPSADETPEETASRIALSARAQEALKRVLEKETIVESYMRNVWGIRFFDSDSGKGLVTLVQEAIEKALTTDY